MKIRPIAFVVALLTITALFTMTVFAADDPILPINEPANEPAEEYNNEQPTVFSRIWEYVNTNSTEVVGMAGDIAIFILAIFVKLRNDKKTKTIAKDLATVKSETTQTLGSQGSVVEVVNNMIEAYNGLSAEYQKLKESYDTYGATEGERSRVVGALVAQNTAILEILTTVYVNSKNLPQGVKDLVNMKYANCLKTMEDDEKLMAVVDAIKTSICAGITEETTQGREEKTYPTEV